jgi:hypothetical protein
MRASWRAGLSNQKRNPGGSSIQQPTGVVQLAPEREVGHPVKARCASVARFDRLDSAILPAKSQELRYVDLVAYLPVAT